MSLYICLSPQCTVDLNLSKLWEIVKEWLGMLQSMGSQRAGRDLVTEQQQQCTRMNPNVIYVSDDDVSM